MSGLLPVGCSLAADLRAGNTSPVTALLSRGLQAAAAPSGSVSRRSTVPATALCGPAQQKRRLRPERAEASSPGRSGRASCRAIQRLAQLRGSLIMPTRYGPGCEPDHTHAFFLAAARFFLRTAQALDSRAESAAERHDGTADRRQRAGTAGAADAILSEILTGPGCALEGCHVVGRFRAPADGRSACRSPRRLQLVARLAARSAAPGHGADRACQGSRHRNDRRPARGADGLPRGPGGAARGHLLPRARRSAAGSSGSTRSSISR